MSQGVAKRVEEEDPEFTSFNRHANICAIYRATSSENDLKTSRKNYHSSRHKEGITAIWLGEAEMSCHQDL